MRQTSKRFDTPYEIDIVKSLSVSSRGSSCSCVRARGWSRSSTRCSTFSGTRSRSRGFLTMILRQFVFACGSRWATLCTRGSVEDNSPFSSRERTSWHFTVMQDYKFSFRTTNHQSGKKAYATPTSGGLFHVGIQVDPPNLE